MMVQEHRELVEAEKQGRILVGVDRVYARKLYTDVSLRRIKELTGEPVYLEKAVVWFSFLGTPLTLVAACVFAIIAFRWWACIAVPSAVMAWFTYSSMSARGGARIGLITVLLAAATTVAILGVVAAFWTNLFIIALLLSLWMNRLLYVASTFFLRAFVLRSSQAWNAFEDGLVVRTVEQPS
jgi:hypothetical protein